MGVYRYCGRDFSSGEIETIRAIVARDPGNSRTAISRLVCEALQWYKPDGGLKDMSCRVAMLRMCESGLISLPPSRGLNGNPKMEIRFTEGDCGKALSEDSGRAFDRPAFRFGFRKKAILLVERIHSSISLFRLQEASGRPVAIHGPKRQRHAGPAGLRRGRLENGSEGPIYRVERSPTAEQAEFDREQLAISGPSLGEFEKPRIQNSRRNSKKASSGLAFEVQSETGFIGDIRRIRQIQRDMLQSGQLDFRRADKRQRKAWRP